MFESVTHSVPRRIVSLAQPWVRPIVRRKAHANTEFGAKLHISLVNGYVKIERLDFEPYNESEDLWRAVARYRERSGCYPERILADKIYRNRQAFGFCKEHGIRLSGLALGKPPKDQSISRQAKKQEYQDSCARSAVEAVFGTGKTAYGLARVMAHLRETAYCVIGAALLLLNLTRSLKASLCLLLAGCSGCTAGVMEWALSMCSLYKSYDELPLFLNTKGVSAGAQRSGSGGERRSSGMSEPCRLRRGEGYGACGGEAAKGRSSTSSPQVQFGQLPAQPPLLSGRDTLQQESRARRSERSTVPGQYRQGWRRGMFPLPSGSPAKRRRRALFPRPLRPTRSSFQLVSIWRFSLSNTGARPPS